MNGCKATTLFGIKSVVQENPYILMSVLFISSALISAYAMQVFERKAQPDLGLFANSFWLIGVTMTTVGYGDLSPQTIGGRTVGMTCCIVGVFITSFTTIALNSFLHFTPPENKAYLLLQRLYWKELIQREAGKAVVTLFKHKLLS